MSLPVAWILAGIPINILCSDLVCSLHKGLPVNPKTGKPVKPPENMPHITAQKVLPKCLQMFLPQEVCPHPSSAPRPPQKVYGENSLKDFLSFLTSQIQTFL